MFIVALPKPHVFIYLSIYLSIHLSISSSVHKNCATYTDIRYTHISPSVSLIPLTHLARCILTVLDAPSHAEVCAAANTIPRAAYTASGARTRILADGGPPLEPTVRRYDTIWLKEDSIWSCKTKTNGRSTFCVFLANTMSWPCRS